MPKKLFLHFLAELLEESRYKELLHMSSQTTWCFAPFSSRHVIIIVPLPANNTMPFTITKELMLN